MCGRFQIALSWAQIVDLYRAASLGVEPLHVDPSADWRASWSVCPTHSVPTLSRDGAGRPRLALARWGFPTPWVARQGKDPWSRPLINARSEEAASKRTWAAPLRRDRRVVPATAWIEWASIDGRKLPTALRASTPRSSIHAAIEPAEGVSSTIRQGPVMHLAAVGATFERDGLPVEVISLLTRAAVGQALRVHDRMPVLIPDGALDAWIGGGPGPDPASWPVPEVTLEPLSTQAFKRSRALHEPPEPGDWSLSLLDAP